MTPPSLPPAMDPEQQRIAIAKAVKPEHSLWHCNIVGKFYQFDNSNPAIQSEEYWDLPNFTGSLDAMHEAEKVLTDDWEQEKYLCWIQTVVSGRKCFKTSEADAWILATATASQKAEALLKTKDLWTPTK